MGSSSIRAARSGGALLRQLSHRRLSSDLKRATMVLQRCATAQTLRQSGTSETQGAPTHSEPSRFSDTSSDVGGADRSGRELRLSPASHAGARCSNALGRSSTLSRSWKASDARRVI